MKDNPAHGRGLDYMIFKGLFQLKTYCNSMFLCYLLWVTLLALKLSSLHVVSCTPREHPYSNYLKKIQEIKSRIRIERVFLAH